MFLDLDHKETGKTGLEMASGVMSVLVSTKSTKSLRAAGFDSTSSNTGYIKGMAMRVVEFSNGGYTISQIFA